MRGGRHRLPETPLSPGDRPHLGPKPVGGARGVSGQSRPGRTRAEDPLPVRGGGASSAQLPALPPPRPPLSLLLLPPPRRRRLRLPRLPASPPAAGSGSGRRRGSGQAIRAAAAATAAAAPAAPSGPPRSAAAIRPWAQARGAGSRAFRSGTATPPAALPARSLPEEPSPRPAARPACPGPLGPA